MMMMADNATTWDNSSSVLARSIRSPVVLESAGGHRWGHPTGEWDSSSSYLSPPVDWNQSSRAIEVSMIFTAGIPFPDLVHFFLGLEQPFG